MRTATAEKSIHQSAEEYWASDAQVTISCLHKSAQLLINIEKLVLKVDNHEVFRTLHVCTLALLRCKRKIANAPPSTLHHVSCSLGLAIKWRTTAPSQRLRPAGVLTSRVEVFARSIRIVIIRPTKDISMEAVIITNIQISMSGSR